MLLTVIRLKSGLNLLVLSEKELQKYLLAEVEWNTLNNIITVLFHFKKVSDLLCGEKYSTLPFVIVQFNLILDEIESTVKSFDEKSKRSESDKLLIFAIQTGRDKILKHYHKFNWVYCAVLILDPRFKLKTFKKTEWGLEMMSKSYEKFLTIFKTYSTDNVAHDNHKKTKEMNNNTLDDDYDFLYATEDEITFNTWESELDAYLKSPRAPRDTDILCWWKNNSYLYPTLAKMAQVYLCIPATSVPCERVFSEAGNVITSKRCSLSEERAAAQICIDSWMKSKLKNKICQVRILILKFNLN